MKKEIPIMFCYDKNYVIPAAVAFYSLMENASKKYNYVFYTLHSDISDEQQQKLKETVSKFKNCRLEFINMKHRLDDFWKNNYRGGHFSKEVMYKLLVASIFPNLDKIIVSDVDVVFLNDISQSYFDLTDKDDAYIAGVKPIGKVNIYLKNYEKQWAKEEISKLGNICGGYLVMNLKKIRQDNFEKVFLKSLEENGYRLNQMEQDIFNITCYGKIKHLHLKYVACSYMWDYYKTDYDKETDAFYSKKEIDEAMSHPVQLHYATSIKPWKNVNCTLSVEWFKYLVKTPFAEEFFQQLPKKIVIRRKEKKSLPAKIRQRIYVFFDEHDDKRIIRYLKYVYTGIDTVIHNPKIIFKKSTYKSVIKKIRYKKFSLIICNDSFPDFKTNYRNKQYLKYIEEFKNTFIISDGSSFDNQEKFSLNYLVDNTINNNFKFYGKLLPFKNYNSDNFEKFIAERENPILLIECEKENNNQINTLTSIIKKYKIPFIIDLTKLVEISSSYQKSLNKLFKLKYLFKVIINKDSLKEKNVSDKLFIVDNIVNDKQETILKIKLIDGLLKNSYRK